MTDLSASKVGKTVPIAGRSIPLSRPKRKRAAAIAAPECPAETTASARFFLTNSIATLIEAFGLRRRAVKGSSSIEMTPSASTISKFWGLAGCCLR